MGLIMKSKVKVTLIKSTIGQKPAVKATVRSLGLKKISSTVTHEENLAVTGMIKAVQHLVKVENVKEAE